MNSKVTILFSLALSVLAGCNDPIAITEAGRCPYTFDQLEHWFRTGTQVLAVPGTTVFDNDEVARCLVVGVKELSVKPAVEAKLIELGVPRDAVLIRVVPPVIQAYF